MESKMTEENKELRNCPFCGNTITVVKKAGGEFVFTCSGGTCLMPEIFTLYPEDIRKFFNFACVWKEIDRLKLSCSKKEMELSTLKSQNQRMKMALLDADTLIMNLKVYHGFPPGDDCEEVRKIIKEALKEVKE